MDVSFERLESFIVEAKAVTYVGDGEKSPSSRPKSVDLRYAAGEFAYHDTYFGDADFVGEEVVTFRGQPVWAMNYYGRILEPALITPAEVGKILKEGLTAMYREGRFLGGFEHDTGSGVYVDTSEGDARAFGGKEWITREGVTVYQLVYHGGLIR